ncbi:ABC transporter substrate-binding protein SapA [Idiomarina xiamenensis]|uniref:Peptide ABC transporter substrate-binding protein n=1 Tax=Idiomarina xiamenensis 10-D-4 TaxID=740709 RepID=K2KDH6_9GAMM|nr:ABC transporter substrate-binding protein SapA [Idiomarina xiamenensis]EKE84767.1 peptide ABC transporter substrate-binding protein [Idiomarina xiamenensis 10-D-4]
MKIRSTLLSTGWLSLVGVLLAGCQPQQRPEPLQQGLIYCSEGNPESFNPQLGTSGTTIDATAAQLYDRLLDYDADEKRFLPALATDWQVLDDGHRYRFHLRHDVQFHHTDYFSPSRTFNADDVLFSFRRWLDKNSAYHRVNGGSYPFFTATGLDQLITAVTKVDDYTVDIELQYSDSSFLANLASDFAIILSAEYAQQLQANGYPERIDRLPIGTGPFVFEQFRKDVLIRYQRNPDYWREGPYIEQLVYSITPNANKRMLKLLTGECDVIPYPLISEIDTLVDNRSIDVSSEISPNVAFWAFNTERPPFDDARVRRALSYAINQAAIIQAIYYGNAKQADSLLPQTSWAFANVSEAYEYNPARARQLLDEAGYGRLSIDIWAMPVQRAYNPNAYRMAELIQADLARIGVDAHIISYEWNTFRRRLARGEHDSVLIGWSADNADPDNFFRPLLSCAAVATGNNRANWCNAAFDNIIFDAISSSDREQRQRLYDRAQRLVAEQMPLVPIAHSLRYQASQASISGIKPPAYGGISFRQARIDRAATEEQ